MYKTYFCDVTIFQRQHMSGRLQTDRQTDIFSTVSVLSVIEFVCLFSFPQSSYHRGYVVKSIFFCLSIFLIPVPVHVFICIFLLYIYHCLHIFLYASLSISVRVCLSMLSVFPPLSIDLAIWKCILG